MQVETVEDCLSVFCSEELHYGEHVDLTDASAQSEAAIKTASADIKAKVCDSNPGLPSPVLNRPESSSILMQNPRCGCTFLRRSVSSGK